MEFENIIEDLKCPLSGKIFQNPVLAGDNEVYEANELEIWMETNGFVSPKTKEFMDSDTILVIPLKALIDELVQRNPSLKEMQYKGSGVLRSFTSNKSQILDKIINGKFDELLNYKNFSLSGIGIDGISRLLKSGNSVIIKHVFDNCLDLGAPILVGWGHRKWSIINCVAKYGTFDILKHVIELGNKIDINSPCEGDGWTPMHQAAENRKYDCVKLLIQKGANLLAKTNEGTTALAFIMQYGDEPIIKFAIDHLITNYKPVGIKFDQEINYLQANETLDVMKMMEYGSILSSLSSST